MSIHEQVGQTTRSFFDVLRDQPLSLALVVMNFLLVAFLFYSGTAQLKQRQETTAQIIKWQQDTDKLMANCVSKEVTDMMLNNVQRITETMLANTQLEIARMQTAIEAERARNAKLAEQLLEMIKPRTAPQSFEQSKPIDFLFQDCDPLGPFCMPP